MPHRLLVLLLLFAALPRGSAAAPSASTVETFSLPNGLTVLLRKLPGAPSAAVAVVYRIGADHDPKGACGLASLIEGLYLTAATPTLACRSCDVVDARPPEGAPGTARFEHVTADDHTCFARVLPASELTLELEDVAQRMGVLHITDEDVASARERLVERIRQAYEGIPETASRLRARERLVEAPNGGRRLGRLADVRALTAAQVRDRVSHLYKARNAVLAVAGDFDVAAVKALVRKRFVEVPPGDDAPALGERVPAPTGTEWDGVGDGPAIFAVAEASKAVPGSVTLAVLAPHQGAAKGYAAFLLLVTRLLDVAADAGAGGGSAAQPSYDPDGDPAVLYLTLPLPDGASAAQAAALLRETLVEIARAPVGPGDTVRARARLPRLFGATFPADASTLDLFAIVRGDARRAFTGLDLETLLHFVGDAKTDDLRLAIGRPQRCAAAIPSR
jgi:zinc protease